MHSTACGKKLCFNVGPDFSVSLSRGQCREQVMSRGSGILYKTAAPPPPNVG